MFYIAYRQLLLYNKMANLNVSYYHINESEKEDYEGSEIYLRIWTAAFQREE